MPYEVQLPEKCCENCHFSRKDDIAMQVICAHSPLPDGAGACGCVESAGLCEFWQESRTISRRNDLLRGVDDAWVGIGKAHEQLVDNGMVLPKMPHEEIEELLSYLADVKRLAGQLQAVARAQWMADRGLA